MSSERMRRVNEAIREVIGEVASKELKDPRVGFVTVTDVKTSPDLCYARVYVSALERNGHAVAESAREATLQGLRSAHGYLQHRLADELRLRRTPVLSFVYDDTPERALRVGELIDAAGPSREDEEERE
jgi:ribosome-binding factor A